MAWSNSVAGSLKVIIIIIIIIIIYIYIYIYNGVWGGIVVKW